MADIPAGLSSQIGAFLRYHDGSIEDTRSPGAHLYSTDPSLSLQRRQDPDYTDSSDQPPLYSSSTIDLEVISSSPPHDDCILLNRELDDNMVDDPTDEDPTEDDEDHDMGADRQITLRHGTSMRSYKLAKSESTLRDVAELAVQQVFDNGVDLINLESQGYERMPKAFKALIDHEDLKRSLFHINLSKNHINVLDQFMYNIDRLRYLNLRCNELNELSALIGRWANLEELHLSHNNLTSLPVELLHLPALTTLTTYPNNFLEPSKPDETELLKCDHKPPTLVELTQRSICLIARTLQLTEFQHIIEPWSAKLPNLIAKIMESVIIGRVCSVCLHPVITPFASHLLWTRHPADRSGGFLPYQTTLCSRRCLDKFSESKK